MAKKFSSFAIFGAMRSGSNLLERHINQYNGLKCHGELFNPAFVGSAGNMQYLGISRGERDVEPKKLLEAVQAATPDLIPGFRIFRDHNSNAIDLFLDDPDCAKIILSRSAVDSFVSLKIAKKTDQWLIHDDAHRKSAQIYFDMQEFESYQKVRHAYSGRIAARLKRTGQRFFDIQYGDLNNIEKINALVAFIGGVTPLDTLKQTIRRQNPGALCEKIVNYDEVFQALGLPEPQTLAAAPPRFAPEKGTDLSRAYFCENRAIIFAPIPSAPDGAVRQWLGKIEGVAPENNFGSAAYDDWLSSHPKPLAFSVLRHPVARAYDVFMRKIVFKKPSGFLAIRDILETRFGVFLPPADVGLENSGYDLAAHRAAFKQFLAFIHHNLNDKSGIRTDGRWRTQTDLLAGYEQKLGPCMTIKEPDLDFANSYFTNRLGLPELPDKITVQKPDWPFALLEIYDPEVETLARTAYEADYKNLSFDNWG